MASVFMENLIVKAKQNPKSIIFPEADNIKVLQAARRAMELGVAFPILVGNKEIINAFAEENSVSTDGFRFVDNADEEAVAAVVQKYLSISTELSEKTLIRKSKDPLYFAAACVKVGDADCLAAGNTYTTGEVILASQMMIGMQEGIETISSLGIVEAPGFEGPNGNLLGITDCAVCQNPNAGELADIACASADTIKNLLGWDPKVALICFSTDGSGQHEITEKVVEAVKIANTKRPHLDIDGEFQLDAAINPNVAARKVKRESKVAGKANIIVFPDLNAGNIGVKLIQAFGKALAHGPLLQGFAKPVTDFSRSAPVEEIVGNLVMLVLKAGK